MITQLRNTYECYENNRISLRNTVSLPSVQEKPERPEHDHEDDEDDDIPEMPEMPEAPPLPEPTEAPPPSPPSPPDVLEKDVFKWTAWDEAKFQGRNRK